MITIPSLKRKCDSSIKEGSDHDFLASCENSVHRQNKRQKGQALRIEIPVAPDSGLLNHEEQHSSPNSSSSLFSAKCSESLFSFNDTSDEGDIVDISPSATRTPPPIPGLFFEPSLLLPQELANSVSSYCLDTYFKSPGVNQVMLFARFLPPPTSPIVYSDDMHSSLNLTIGLPHVLLRLLDTISTLLKPLLSPPTHTLLFPVNPTKARQAIINLYQPGEGITPHIDLLGRYGDGIIGVSFSSSCVMRFDKTQPGTQSDEDGGVRQDKRTRWDLFLPERSILVLSGEARYDWTHGIDKKKRDFVSLPTDTTNQDTLRLDTNSSMTVSSSSLQPSDGTWIARGTRLSITFRWLLPGADVVGNDVSQRVSLP